uniref:Protein HEATR9 isoform X5 n=1 Tax=Phascolarctos cinereus TaxID=38626 RepID=A0A6P5LZS5_PHACI|nr:protein HEATR9 isoform X5 [Phascolarctos cinereus]
MWFTLSFSSALRFLLTALETGDMHSSNMYMEKLPLPSTSIPELTWKSQEDEEKSKAGVSNIPTVPLHMEKVNPQEAQELQPCNEIPSYLHGTRTEGSTQGLGPGPVTFKKQRVKFSTQKIQVFEDRLIHPLKWQRLKDLTHSLSSPVEAEQVYAAQALGKLRISKTFIIEALWASAQVGPERVRYESSRTLALLGCLHKHVVLSLIEQLKGCSLSRRMDTLVGLHMALNAWIMLAKNKREPIGAKSSLTRVLKLLVKGKSPMDNVALEAALCLSFLDPENSIARDFLLQCLTQGEMKRKKKHRLEAIKLLKIIGLEKIQNLGMEKDFFELLRFKVHNDPLQEVREAVAEMVEVLKMKPMMLNIVESQLNDASALVRHEAVISIGVLGICSSRMFYFLMDMLDLETSPLVRKELEKIFITLSKKDPWIREKLQDWKLLMEEESRQERERIQTLEFQKMKRDLQDQKKSLLKGLGPLIPRKMVQPKKAMADKGKSILSVPIKGMALASHYPPCIKLVDKKDHMFSKGSWDSPVIRKHLKNLASH